MNMMTIAFFVLVMLVLGVSAALMWHWKTYMPEQGKGAGVFTVYMVGLVVLIMALFTSISAL